MRIRLHLKVMTCCVGAAIAQMGAEQAFADSGVGVDTALGNALNPPGRSAIPRPLEADGFDSVRHSPTGQLYGVPYDVSGEPSKTESGWEYTGGIEAGVLGGDANKKNAKFREYKDLKNSLYLNYFEVEADKPADARYIQSFGGGTGQHDQFYGLQFGRYNDWKVKLFYNETIHVFTDTYKSLYDGVGSGNLMLTGGLAGAAGATRITSGTYTAGSANYVGATSTCSLTTPCWGFGGKVYSNAVALNNINGVLGTYATNGTTLTSTTQQSNLSAAINNQLAATDNSELSLVRKKGGARLDMNLTDNWKAYGSFTQEKRTGARPFSMNYGSGNMTVEIPEPIDYTTTDLLGGLQYSDRLNALNLRASASIFRNNIDTLTIANPLFSPATPWGAVNQSTFDLNPDSTAFNLKGEYGRKLPDFFNGRFTATVAYGSNRQNDSLMAPIGSNVATMTGIAPGAGFGTAVTGTNYFDVNKWNTTAALSQQTANQRLDTKLLDLGLTLKPIDDLSVKGSLRHYETVNKANDGSGHQYTAYNPLTGQYGVIRYNDSPGLVVGSSTGLVGSPCYTPNGAVIPGCLWSGPSPLAAAAQATNNPTGVVVYSLARDYKQDNYGLSADYDLGGRSSVEGSYERETYTRRMRERDKTWEDKLKLGYVNRDFDIATLRASFETDRRRGGEYNSGLLPNVPYYQQVAYGLALPGNSLSSLISNYIASYLAGCTPTQTTACGTAGFGFAATAAGVQNATTLNNYLARYPAQAMKMDLADRDQNILNGRVNFMPREDLDVGVMLQLKNAKYPETIYGAEKDDLTSLNFDINYQPSTSRQIMAYYSRQDGTKKQTSTASGGSCTFAGLGTSLANWLANCAMTTAGAAGTGMYPTTSLWHMTTKDTNDIIGLSFQQDIGRTRLAVDYTYAEGRTKISYDYGATATAQAAIEAILGNAMPNMTTVQHTLSMNLLVPIDRRLSTRLMYRYESFKVKDWHYDDVITGQIQQMDGGTLLLDSGPQKFHANVFGVFLQYKL
jgi:hypothetical protein